MLCVWNEIESIIFPIQQSHLSNSENDIVSVCQRPQFPIIGALLEYLNQIAQQTIQTIRNAWNQFDIWHYNFKYVFIFRFGRYKQFEQCFSPLKSSLHVIFFNNQTFDRFDAVVVGFFFCWSVPLWSQFIPCNNLIYYHASRSSRSRH